MVQVTKLGYAGFDTPNLEAMLSYYTEVIGLTLVERGDGGTVYLRNVVDHHTIALHPAQEAGLSYIGMQLAGNQALKEVAKQLSESGIKTELRTDAEPGVSELLQISDPEGHTLQLYTAMEQVSTGFPEVGIVPEKLGHIALAVQSAKTMCDFYQDTLGFRVSDWIEDFFVFMRCSPDHHTMNFLQSKKYQKMHHIAFQLKDWAQVQKACDHLAKHNIPLAWGPGRHGAGHNIFTYHNDPDGQIVELFTELDILNEELGYFEPRPWHEEFPQRPKVWQDAPRAVNHWGLLPSPEFMFMT